MHKITRRTQVNEIRDKYKANLNYSSDQKSNDLENQYDFKVDAESVSSKLWELMVKHNKIKLNSSERPSLYLIGGQPGAGKSRLMTNLIKEDPSIFVINLTNIEAYVNCMSTFMINMELRHLNIQLHLSQRF